MTNRVQTIRSNVTGARVSGRPPGELYVNWADMQLGVSTPAQTPQDLVAVRFFSPTANYAVGDHVLQGGFLWRAVIAITAGVFNPLQWMQVSGATGGGGGGGGGGGSGSNRLINGDFRIHQRIGPFTNVMGDWLADHWEFYAKSTGTGPSPSGGQNLDGASTVPGFPYYGRLKMAATAYTPALNDYWVVSQYIEAQDIADLYWGTPGAVAVTLSFWARCSTAGTFSGSISNFLVGSTPHRNRSYPFTFTLPANTWTQCTIANIPGDTTGTWNSSLYDYTPGLIVNFCYTAGASLLGPPGAWASANYVGATGSTPLISSAGVANSFDLTGVKLEVGNVATAYQRQKLVPQLQECQRYFCKTYNYYTAPATPTGANGGVMAYAGPTTDTHSQLGSMWKFPVTMSGPPTIRPYSPNSGAIGVGYLVNANVDIPVFGYSQSSETTYLGVDNITSRTVNARETLIVHATAETEYNIIF